MQRAAAQGDREKFFETQVEAKKLIERCLRRKSHTSKVSKLKREVLQ